MTRYCLPTGVTDMSALDLIQFEQRLQGVQPPYPLPSAGALALAAWLLRDLNRAAVMSRQAASPLSMGSVISRVLAGEVEPSDQLACAIALMTLGAVLPEMWTETPDTASAGPAGGGDYAAGAIAGGEAALIASPHSQSTANGAADVAGAPPMPHQGAPVTIGIDLGGPDGDMLAIAVLGETPPGPLFGVIPPSGKMPFFEVHGLGVAFRLAESGTRALHAALGSALAVADKRAAA